MNIPTKKKEDCEALKNSAAYYRAMALAANHAGLMGSYMSSFFSKQIEYEQCIKDVSSKEEKKTHDLK